MSFDLFSPSARPLPPPKPHKGRSAAAAAPKTLADANPHYSTFRRPVSANFLSKIVGKQVRQIERRLEKCPVADWTVTTQGNQTPLYNFLDAMAYLIPPRGNIEDWFAQQNAASLPPYVNKMWWDSAHQRNRVMLQSNDLWTTESVMAVFGEIAMLIRQEVKMWVEDLPEKELLNDQQYNALIDATNRLIDDVREKLIDMPQHTRSMSDQISGELAVGGEIADEDRAVADE